MRGRRVSRSRAPRRSRGSCGPSSSCRRRSIPAFDKAAHYFGVKLVKVPVGADFRADVRAMAQGDRLADDRHRRVGAAVSARRRRSDRRARRARAEDSGLPLHVDACVGGFMLPWLEQLGRPVPRVGLPRPGRDVDQRRPPQVRLRGQGRVDARCGARSTTCSTRSSSRPTSRAASTRRRR